MEEVRTDKVTYIDKLMIDLMRVVREDMKRNILVAIGEEEVDDDYGALDSLCKLDTLIYQKDEYNGNERVGLCNIEMCCYCDYCYGIRSLGVFR